MADTQEESKILGLTLTQFSILVCVLITICLGSMLMAGMASMSRMSMYGGGYGGYGGYGGMW
jgi:hypothetical protein